ncbi:hypothetical protein L1987_64479 [Smallanthus sonchifolius]|uniref:Uncharacterized protein n=1 Tax=Smallanthus sonchifolius TaxID=185202 RepID=A0ACB9CG34_9ASTR|nr:hypothetical protein L1987_64479 [Smallanthus sonchifolius]
MQYATNLLLQKHQKQPGTQSGQGSGGGSSRDHVTGSSNCQNGRILVSCFVKTSHHEEYLCVKVSCGGQTVTLVGTNLAIFGGQDGNKTLLNDLHILDLETKTWDEIDIM